MSIDPARLEAAEALVRIKARKLSRRRGFNRADADDIAQELLMHMTQQAAKFDPTITTWEQFLSFIFDKRGISLVRHTFAERRSPAREGCSLNEPVTDCDGREVEKHQTTPEVASDTGHLRDLERDMASVLSVLPDDLRAVALGLAARTPHGVAAELGISRRAMVKAVEQLREIFHDAGLDEYL